MVIVSGSVGGQIVVLAFSPLLTRQYGPSGLGLFTVFVSLVTLFSVLASARLELAVPLPESDRDGFLLTGIALTCCGMTCLGGTLVAAAVAVWLLPADQSAFAGFILFVPLAGALVAAFQALNQLAIRQQEFGRIGRRNLLQAGVTSSAQVSLGAIGIQPLGLLIGYCLGQAAGVVSLLRGSGLRAPHLRSAAVRTRLRALLIRYRRFPLVSAPSGLINVAGVVLPPVLVGAFYGVSDAGQFGLAQRTLALPIFVIGTAIGQVYLGSLSRARREGTRSVDALFSRSTRRLLLVAACCAVPVAALGPWMYALVFGPEWRLSGEFARALALCLGFQMVASPLSQTLIVLERQVHMLIWDISRLMFTSFAIVGASWAGRPVLEAVWGFSIVSAALYVALWWMCRRAAASVSPVDAIQESGSGNAR